MEMNQPAKANPLDENRTGLIGKPIDRTDGRLKVTGQAPYAYEVHEGGKPVYGHVLEASIAKGRIAALGTGVAEAAPGVLLMMTYRNAPPQAAYGPMDMEDRFARAKPQLGSDRILYYGEPVAFVVAESFKQARAAARLIAITYAAEAGEFELKSALNKATKPAGEGEKSPDSSTGNFDQAFSEAPVTIDATFTTPVHIHAQMEPHASLAYWKDGRVHIHCSSQLLESAQKCVANTLQIPVSKVRIVSRYIGGGFGGKLPIYGDVLLAAMASRQLNRPVKTALTRQQMFHVTTHRSDTVQRLRLGASRDGVLTAC